MEKVVNFLRDNANRYSFHFLAWIAYVFVFICMCIYFLLYSQVKNDYELGDAYAWYLIFCYACFYPFIFGLMAFIYVRLRLKERKQPSFRIKNKFITENLFYRIFIVLSVIISFLFFVTLLYLPILGIIANPDTLLFAITAPFYKITICILILYLLAFFIK